MNSLSKNMALLSELGKFRITSFVAFSTTIGYILAAGRIDIGVILPTVGVLFLAMSSSALNHFQESDIDAKMKRTENRPIPSGRISELKVLYITFLLFIAGSTILVLSSDVTALLVGWLAFVWYNLVYTPLKRKYAFAVFPGSLIGALPPIIGWIAAGGNLFDSEVLALAMFFFIWQVPHFWLLLLLYGREYEDAGLPTLTQIFNNAQLSRITFIWIIGLTASCFLIPLFGISKSIITSIVLIALAIWLIFSTGKVLLFFFDRSSYRKAFMQINFYVLAVVFTLSIDELLLNDF